jgi:hypothetical protein
MKKLLSTNDWFARHIGFTSAIIGFLYIVACSI